MWRGRVRQTSVSVRPSERGWDRKVVSARTEKTGAPRSTVQLWARRRLLAYCLVHPRKARIWPKSWAIPWGWTREDLPIKEGEGGGLRRPWASFHWSRFNKSLPLPTSTPGACGPRATCLMPTLVTPHHNWPPASVPTPPRGPLPYYEYASMG